MRFRGLRFVALALVGCLLVPGGSFSASAVAELLVESAGGTEAVAAPAGGRSVPVGWWDEPGPLPPPLAPAEPTLEPTPQATPAVHFRGPDLVPTRPPLVHPTPGALVVRLAAPAPKSAVNYVGRNHLWAPSLGISADWKRVADCLVSIPNGLIDWRCSGMTDPSNLYLAAHNTSTFASFRRAFLDGKMQPGMRVVTADAKGGIHHWRLAWVKKLTKLEANADASIWGAAPGGGQVMTWQTCYDIGSAAVLIIARWVPAGS